MSIKSYLRVIDEDSRIRVSMKIEKGEIKNFMIQYEILIKGEWIGIVRYDTSHNFVHKDIIHSDGTKEKVLLNFNDFGSALIFAQEDLKRNFKVYRDKFLKETKNE